jgi:hypothetical protein
MRRNAALPRCAWSRYNFFVNLNRRAIAMKFFAGALLLCFALVGSAQNTPAPPSRDFKLAVDVDLVVFNVTVTDSNGHPAKGFAEGQFPDH